MNARIIAIHQPNFFPWLGYFNKAARSDVFCLLDGVQFPKKGGTWINRVRIAVNGQPTWATVPIVRQYSGTRKITEMRIRGDQPWREKFEKTLHASYGRSPFFDETMTLLQPMLRNPTNDLAAYNESAIRSLAKALGLNTRIVRQSDLNVSGSSTNLLIDIVKSVDGTAYFCGGGASGYQEDDLFEAAGIELVYQGFEHPVYPQLKTSEFLPGLSIIDSLMNCGIDETASLVCSGGDNAIGDQRRKCA